MNINIPYWWSMTKGEREQLAEHLMAKVLDARGLEDSKTNEAFKQHYRAFARDFLTMYYAMFDWKPRELVKVPPTEEK